MLQVLGTIAEFAKASLVATLKTARDRKHDSPNVVAGMLKVTDAAIARATE